MCIRDSYKGVIIFCRVMEGTVKKGTPIRMMATGAEEEVVEVGYFGAGQFFPCDELAAGMVGYITASIKNVRDTRVGDTVTDSSNPCEDVYKRQNYNSGVFNSISTFLGLGKQGFFTDVKQALWCIVMMATWKGCGYWMMYILAGLRCV